MKKILLLAVLALGVYAAQVKIVESANVRDSSEWRTSEVIHYVDAGRTFNLLEEAGDWYKVKVLSGSDHAGKVGYMWSARVDREKGEVIIEGVCLRKTPEMQDNGTPGNKDDDPNLIAKVRVGTKVEILEVVATWFKIERGPDDNWKVGWVSASKAKKVE